MRNRFKFAFGLLAATLVAFPASAATYFVKSGATGNGSSWTSAWNINTIGWSSLSAGDTVCIAGGTYSGTLTTGKSGTAGGPIVVRRAVASDATCGSSTAGWSSSYDAQVVIAGINLQNDYVTIDGAVANGIKMNLANSSGSPSAIGVSGPTNSVTLRYIEVAGPCGTTACNQNGDSRSIDLNHWNGASYDLQNNMLIQYANLHGACTIMWSAHSTNGIIEHSRFADSADSTPGNPNCHPNVIAEQDSTNMTFRYNEVTNWEVEGIMACPNGGCSSSWDIYGNLWHDPMTDSYPRVLEAQGNSNGPYHFYNNTVVGVSYAVHSTANGGSFAAGSVGNNNIYWNTPGPGLPSNDYDLCNSNCSETHLQTYSNTNLFTNYSGQNYSLAIATTAGVTLPSPYNMDYIGVTRGADGTWDRGAYEYASGGGQAPAPPTNLTVIVQ
jgi:hypothetical protein